MMKRPVMLSEKSMVIGYDDDEITTFMPRSDRSDLLRTPLDEEPGRIELSF